MSTPQLRARLLLLLFAALLILGTDLYFHNHPPHTAMETAVSATFQKLQSSNTLPAWNGANIGNIREAVQSKKQLYRLDLDPVWIADVILQNRSVGYFMIESKAPHNLIDFGVDSATPFVIRKGITEAIESVPNLQQFAVPGQTAPKAASGCVPTSAANVLGYWAANGFPQFAVDVDNSSSLQAITLKLRNHLSLKEFSDEAGYTETGMPLTGATMDSLEHALQNVAQELGVKLRTKTRPFSVTEYLKEIQQGHPALLSCSVRLPHKPDLSWGHAVTGIGWTRLDDDFFVMIRDNFYPSQHRNAVRWIRADAFQELLSLDPQSD